MTISLTVDEPQDCKLTHYSYIEIINTHIFNKLITSSCLKTFELQQNNLSSIFLKMKKQQMLNYKKNRSSKTLQI